MSVHAPPEPEFAVLEARPVRHAAVPMLALDLHVCERSGREVYMIALGVQVMIDPARRAYDAETHGRLVELFGAPERWSVTTRSLVWARLDVLVGAFRHQTVAEVALPLSFDLELAAVKYLYALPDGEAPLGLHFNGTVYYREGDALQMSLVPWSCSIDFRLPVAVWREAIESVYPSRAWLAVREDTYRALVEARLRRGAATLDQALRALLSEAGDA